MRAEEPVAEFLWLNSEIDSVHFITNVRDRTLENFSEAILQTFLQLISFWDSFVHVVWKQIDIIFFHVNVWSAAYTVRRGGMGTQNATPIYVSDMQFSLLTKFVIKYIFFTYSDWNLIRWCKFFLMKGRSRFVFCQIYTPSFPPFPFPFPLS